jgi:hypothetical protein
MPRLFRTIGVGNNDFSAFIEDSERAVTMTINSEPKVRFELFGFDTKSREQEASELLQEWIGKFGISDDTKGGGALAERLIELGKMHSAGLLTDKEFATAKSKLLGL